MSIDVNNHYFRNILLEIKEKCKRNEEKLWEYYCDCLLELQYSFTKYEQTDMVPYFNTMMERVYPLVIHYFRNRYDAYRDSDLDERAEILNDVEVSIIAFSNAYNTLIKSINDADWIQVQNYPMSTGLYSVPKLSAYYAALLNKLAEIYQENGKNDFGFCVYPTLDSLAEVRYLFSSYQDEGRVGIVKIPRKDIINIKYLNQLLLHEFHHVLPSSQRKREERAAYYQKILKYDISNRVLDGIENNMKEKLMKMFLKEFDRNTGGSNIELNQPQKYYSTETINYFSDLFENTLMCLLKKKVDEYAEEIYQEDEYSNIEDYISKMKEVEKCRDKITDNVIEMLKAREVVLFCKFHMDIFREVFSDILSILVLGSTAEIWLSTFEHQSIEKECFLNSFEVELRMALVCKVMSDGEEYFCDQSFGNWKLWVEKLLNDSNEKQSSICQRIRSILLLFDREDLSEAKSYKNNMKSKHKTIGVFSHKAIWQIYLDYFNLCKNGFMLSVEKQQKIKAVRQQFYLFPDSDNEVVLQKISYRGWEPNRLLRN